MKTPLLWCPSGPARPLLPCALEGIPAWAGPCPTQEDAQSVSRGYLEILVEIYPSRTGMAAFNPFPP